jgi:PAS domain-containing protein
MSRHLEAKKRNKRVQRRRKRKVAVVTIRLTPEKYEHLAGAREEDSAKYSSLQGLMVDLINQYLFNRNDRHVQSAPMTVLAERDRALLQKTRDEVRLVGRLLEQIGSREDLISFLLRRVVDVIPASIVLKDEDLKIVWANSAFQKRTGRKSEELVGKTFAEIFDDDDYIAWISRMEHETMDNHHRVWIGPLPGEVDDRFRATLCCPINDLAGVRLASIGFDLGACGPDTEGKHHTVITRNDFLSVYSEANKSTRWHVDFLEALPAVALIKSKDLRILWATKAYTELTAKEPDMVRGRRVGEIWADQETARDIEANDQHVLDSGRTTVCEERVPVNGKLQARLRIRFPIRQSDGTIAFLGALGFDKSQLTDERNLRPRKT